MFAGSPNEVTITYWGTNKGSKITKLEQVKRGKLVSNFKGLSYGKAWQNDTHKLNLLYARSATGFCSDEFGNDTAIKALKYEYPPRRNMRYELKIQDGNTIHTRWLCEEPKTNLKGEVIMKWDTWVDDIHTDKRRTIDFNHPLLPDNIPHQLATS